MTDQKQNSPAELHRLGRLLASLLTQFDQKQSTKRGHNCHALPLYLEAAHSWELDPRTPEKPIATLAKYFTFDHTRDVYDLPPVEKFVQSLLPPPPKRDPECLCGAPRAHWMGDRNGHRVFACSERCARASGLLLPQDRVLETW